MFYQLAFLFLNLFLSKSSNGENLVRLYDSFAEIHQKYQGPLRFRQNDWENIKLETIRIRQKSTNETNQFFERRIQRINGNLTGKMVFVRRFAEQKRSTACELIFEEKGTSIVREIETGLYFRAEQSFIDYPDEPETNSIYEVSFSPIADNDSLMVFYALSNLRWRARYQLEVHFDGATKFEMFADLINTSPLKYEFEQTELMSGDLNVVFQRQSSSALVAPTTNDDLNNVRTFSRINRSLIIDGNSILTIPIVSPSIQVRTFFTFNLVLPMNNLFSGSVLSGKHKFNRLFQLSNSSTFLPAGHLLLYDSSIDVLIGEWQLPTLIETEKYEFELGQDSEVIFFYNRTISNKSNNNSTTVTTNVLIQNYKQNRVTIRFKSSCQISVSCVFYDEKLRTLGSRLRYNLNLEGKSEVAFSFSVLRVS